MTNGRTPQRRAWRMDRLQLWLPLAAMLAVLVAFNIWAYRHLGRLDLTSAGVYTISPASKRVLASIDKPVQVTWFYDLRNKSMVDAMALLQQYAQANPQISVRGVDPGVHPAEARRLGVQFAGSAVFEAGGRAMTVNGGMEADFTNALIRAAHSGHQTACFTQGHLEPNPFSRKELDDPEDHDKDENLVARVEVHERGGYRMARDALETLGFTVKPVQLLQRATALAGCNLVIVAGPKRAFDADEVQTLRAHLAGGGKLLLMLDPGAAHGLDAVLADFGIRHDSRLLMDETSHYKNDAASPAVSDYPRHKITRNVALSFFPGASSFVPLPTGVPRGVNITPLVMSSDNTHPQGQPADSGSRTLMVLATRPISSKPVPEGGKQAALLAVGDSDFGGNNHYALLGNGQLLMNSINYLAEQERLIDIQPAHYSSATVELTNQQMRLTFLVSSVLLPGLALLAGFIVWRRRR